MHKCQALESHLQLLETQPVEMIGTAYSHEPMANLNQFFYRHLPTGLPGSSAVGGW